MKYVFIALAIVCAFACKKKYTCNCTTYPMTATSAATSTMTASQASSSLNQVHYAIKASDESAALTKCEEQYESSGYVVNGKKCVVY